MADDLNIDWSAAPATTGSYINAFKTGQALGIQAGSSPTQVGQFQAQHQGQQGSRPTIGPATAAGQADVSGQDNTAANGGSIGGVATLKATLDALPGDRRSAAIAKAQQTNEQLAHILRAFQGDPEHGVPPIPVAQRLGIARHILSQHPELGLQPSSINQDDVSDFGIRSHLDQAESMDQILKDAQRATAETDLQQPRRAYDRQRVVETHDPNPSANPTPAGANYLAPDAPSQGSGVRYIGKIGGH